MTVGCSTHVHGSNARTLSVQLSLPQTSKKAVSFLLPLMFSLQQNWTRGQKGSAQKQGWGALGGGLNNVYTCK
jgi:hypothetical protein